MKKVLSLIFILFLLPINQIKAEEIDITSDYVLLYNLNDNQIIYEVNSDTQVNIASLTKMMTALTAIENCDDLNKKIEIKKEHFDGLSGYSKAGLKVGDIVTVKDLLYGVLLPSGADACNAIALHISEDMNAFIDLMNKKAKELNLNHTHFDNPIGKDSKNNYSTAYDLSLLLKYALKNPTFKEIFCTKKYKIENIDLNLKSTLYGYSKTYDINTDIISGSKTGYTSGAGYCLASISTIDNIDYMLIVLNADTDLKCNAVLDSLKIYDHFSKNYGYHTIFNKNENLFNIPIKWGIYNKYSIDCKEDIISYIENDFNKENIHIEYDGIDEIDYKIKRDDKLGNLHLLYEDKIIHQIEIYLDKDIMFVDPYFIIIIILSLLTLYIIKRKH